MRFGVWDPHENPGRRPENWTFRALRDGVFRLSMRSPTMSDKVSTVPSSKSRRNDTSTPMDTTVAVEVDASVLHYLAIRETTTAGQFAEAHKLGRTDPDKPTAVLLDLAHILPVSADVWLFKLLVVGAVRDNIGGNVYHRRRADHFSIEETRSEHFDGEWRVELQPQPEASLAERPLRCLTSSILFAVFLWRHPRTSASAKYRRHIPT